MSLSNPSRSSISLRAALASRSAPSSPGVERVDRRDQQRLAVQSCACGSPVSLVMAHAYLAYAAHDDASSCPTPLAARYDPILLRRSIGAADGVATVPRPHAASSTTAKHSEGPGIGHTASSFDRLARRSAIRTRRARCARVALPDRDALPGALAHQPAAGFDFAPIGTFTRAISRVPSGPGSRRRQSEPQDHHVLAVLDHRVQLDPGRAGLAATPLTGLLLGRP